MRKSKVIVLLLIVALALVLVACGKTSESEKAPESEKMGPTETVMPSDTVSEQTPTKTTTTTTTTITTTTTKARKTISIGQTIKTDNFEIHIKDVQITDDILPPDTSGYYTHYEAEGDEIFVYVNADVKNLKTSNVRCDKIYSAKLIYSTGYTYNGQILVLNSPSMFSYPNICGIDPLKTEFVGCMFNCPLEAKTSGEPITIEFNVDGETYCLEYRR